MAVGFERFVGSLEKIGFVDVLLPFLLIFTVIFAVLEKTKILGEGKRNMNVGLAFVFALLVVVPHVTGKFPAGYDPVKVINAALPTVSLLVVAIISLLILIGVFAGDKLVFGMSSAGWIGLFSVIAIVFIFGSSAGWWQTGFLGWLEVVFGSDVVAVLIMILVFGIVIAFVTGGGSEEKVGAMGRIGSALNDLIGGRK
ncbi:MAG: hypothetical protein AABX34_02955 [Nanoarchaeota archaeon]